MIIAVQTAFTGNLVEDPKLRVTNNGHSVANLRLACSERERDKVTGEWADSEVVYLSVTVWRALAENVAASLHKGDQIVVIGRLQQRRYETRDGHAHTGYEVEADMVGAGLAFSTTAMTRMTRSYRSPSIPAVQT